MTRLLLDHGADPNLPEEGAPRGVSLWIAVNDRQREIVRLLLAHGADPNAEVDSSGTPMGQGAKDPEAAGAPWATPVAWAERKGHVEIARVIRDASG